MKQYILYNPNTEEIKYFDNWDMLIVELKALCLKWCSFDYEGPCWESLFEMCLGEKDFHSIASVYEMTGSLVHKDDLTLRFIM